MKISNDKISKRSLACWLGGVLLSLVSIAQAHSDPWGDIHPNVAVVDGKFSITFSTSQPEEPSNYSEKNPLQQMIYTAEGKLFAPRHSLKRTRTHRDFGPVGLYGREIDFGKSTIYFKGNKSPKPGYLLKSPEGNITRIRLPWPKEISLSLLENVAVTPKGIAMTGKEGEELQSDGGPLKFYWFEHDSTEEPKMFNIGTTACIYQFPVASNIAYAGGKFWVAYMRPNEEGLKLSLWSWKPGDKEPRVEDLNAPAFWNSHLSLAAIGDRLCLAYHCVSYRSKGRNAYIETVFREAK